MNILIRPVILAGIQGAGTSVLGGQFQAGGGGLHSTESFLPFNTVPNTDLVGWHNSRQSSGIEPLPSCPGADSLRCVLHQKLWLFSQMPHAQRSQQEEGRGLLMVRGLTCHLGCVTFSCFLIVVFTCITAPCFKVKGRSSCLSTTPFVCSGGQQRGFKYTQISYE